MRSRGEVDAEEALLTTQAGQALLGEVATVDQPRPADLARWRKQASAERVAAAVRLVESRRRGLAKFSKAAEMWLDPVGLEQASSEVVARHKAARFRGSLVVDLCSGIGGDTFALAEVGHVLSVDIDEGMVRRNRWNAKVYGVGERLAPFRCSAEEFPIPPDAYIHIDPDRRAKTSGRRAKDVADYTPGLDYLLSLPRRVKAGAIKLGPASDFAKVFDAPDFEAEIVSLGGECKEATLWFGRLADVRRRATVLPKGATWTDRDAPAKPGKDWISPLSNWVFDPDPSLIRAGLLDGFAEAHGLTRFSTGIDLLTGPEPVVSPFLSMFQVDEILPLDLKKLKKAVADRRLGPLEIKTRGVDLLPESVRKQLKPDGPNPATLVLVGGQGPSMAIVTRRA